MPIAWIRAFPNDTHFLQLEFVKGKKCGACEYAGIIGCNKHDLVFSETKCPYRVNELPPESEEMLSYFSDCKLEVDIYSLRRKRRSILS